MDKIDEIIIVDNNSIEDTSVLKINSKIRVIKLPQNLGFGEACNVALKLTKSEYIYFLNNDTILNETTITALLDSIISNNLGAVGSKVIYPNGQLIEAGCLFRNGKAEPIGHFDNPNKYNEFAIVDYCSACSLLVRKSLIGDGFDPQFSPGYYEDTDLCMRIKQSGSLVGYEPKSTIIHYEHTTSKELFDPYELCNKNRIKFVAKWSLH
jgi:GT2 family glycosyltransferase